jgi:uncharacterized protein YggE
MTISLSPRRIPLILLTVISLAVVYLLGASRYGGTFAAASTSSGNTSSNQPSTIAGVGGPGVTVSGSADVAGTPDTLRLDLSVVATAPTVSAALAKANGSAAAVQKSLLGDGVAKADLQTSGLSITPKYTYPKGGEPRVTGYSVSESLNAKLRDLGRAGDAIGRAVGAGGNAVRVNGISLDLEDTGALVTKARDKAFADAKAKAEQYAKAAGRPLGDVESIAESVATPSPMAQSVSLASRANFSSVPVQPGSQEVRVTVTVVFTMG